MAGINRFEGKDKRRQRLRNHIAKDLRSPKYGQRVVEDKKKHYKTYWDWVEGIESNDE